MDHALIRLHTEFRPPDQNKQGGAAESQKDSSSEGREPRDYFQGTFVAEEIPCEIKTDKNNHEAIPQPLRQRQVFAAVLIHLVQKYLYFVLRGLCETSNIVRLRLHLGEVLGQTPAISVILVRIETCSGRFKQKIRLYCGGFVVVVKETLQLLDNYIQAIIDELFGQENNLARDKYAQQTGIEYSKEDRMTSVDEHAVARRYGL